MTRGCKACVSTGAAIPDENTGWNVWGSLDNVDAIETTVTCPVYEGVLILETIYVVLGCMYIHV